MTEQWKDIPVAEGYQASPSGKIRSLKRPNKPLIVKPYIKEGKNYERIILSVNGKSKSFLVHRLVAMTYLPNPLGLEDIHHLNSNKFDNNLTNLTWISHRDNVLEDQGKTIICTHKDGRVLEIRGGRIAEAQLGVTRRTIIARIKSGTVSRSGWSFKYKK